MPRDAKVLEVGAAELWALALAQVASHSAGELARLGGYAPTPGQWRAMGAAIAGAALEVPRLVEDVAELSDEEIEDVARGIGGRVLREVCGPAPGAH